MSNDQELADLLQSALDDFKQQGDVRQRLPAAAANGPAQSSSSSQTQNGKKSDKSDSVRSDKKKGQKSEPPFDPTMMREVDDIFKNMMTQDPQLKEHWERLAESCSRAGELPHPRPCHFSL
jgi:hypothetical protein